MRKKQGRASCILTALFVILGIVTLPVWLPGLIVVGVLWITILYALDML